MKPWGLVLPCLVVCGFGEVRGQRVEVGAHAGYFLPAVRQFTQQEAIASSTGLVFRYDTAHHEPGMTVGLTGTVWLVADAGLEVTASLRRGDRYSTATGRTEPAVLTVVAFQVVARRRLGATALRLGVGPALVHTGGAAYEGGGGLDHPTFLGGALQVDVSRAVGRVRWRMAVQDAVYRVRLVPLAPGDHATQTPLQHDLAITAGFVVGLRD